MRFANFDDTVFTSVFGDEGFELIAKYDNDLYLVNNETAIQMGMDSSFTAAVVPWQYPGATEATVIMVVNVEKVMSQLNFLEQLSPRIYQKNFRALLVHERTHLDQFADGRMVSCGEFKFWEGVMVDVDGTTTEDYFYTPWEIEAYVNQFMYQYDMTAEEARAYLDTKVANYKQAA